MSIIKSIFQVYTREEAIEVVKKATNALRDDYNDAPLKPLSEKAKRIKEICQGFGTAEGENIAKIFSVLMDEDLSYKSANRKIKFSMLGAIIPNVDGYARGELAFELIECANGNIKCYTVLGNIGPEMTPLRRSFSIASDEQIEEHINLVFDAAEGES